MEFKEFASWAMQGLIGGGVIYAASVIGKMRDSVEALNQSIATIIERSNWHERVIEKHEDRISELEATRRSGP